MSLEDKKILKSISHFGPRQHKSNGGKGEDLNSSVVPLHQRTLRNSRLFTAASNEVVRKIEGMCQWRWTRRGDMILSPSQMEQCVYFIVEGEFSNRHYLPDGGMSEPTMHFGPGDYFGEGRAIRFEIERHDPSTPDMTEETDLGQGFLNISATTPGLLATLPNSDFIDLIFKYPEIGKKFLLLQHKIIAGGGRIVANLRTLNGDQRIVEELIWLAEPVEGDSNRLVIEPMPSQDFIAGSLGVTRRTVARTFNRLTKEKLITRHKQQLIIESAQALRDSAFKPD